MHTNHKSTSNQRTAPRVKLPSVSPYLSDYLLIADPTPYHRTPTTANTVDRAKGDSKLTPFPTLVCLCAHRCCYRCRHRRSYCHRCRYQRDFLGFVTTSSGCRCRYYPSVSLRFTRHYSSTPFVSLHSFIHSKPPSAATATITIFSQFRNQIRLPTLSHVRAIRLG